MRVEKLIWKANFDGQHQPNSHIVRLNTFMWRWHIHINTHSAVKNEWWPSERYDDKFMDYVHDAVDITMGLYDENMMMMKSRRPLKMKCGQLKWITMRTTELRSTLVEYKMLDDEANRVTSIVFERMIARWMSPNHSVCMMMTTTMTKTTTTTISQRCMGQWAIISHLLILSSTHCNVEKMMRPFFSKCQFLCVQRTIRLWTMQQTHQHGRVVDTVSTTTTAKIRLWANRLRR